MRAVILTVIVPTHNPHGARLARTLNGLRTQTLPLEQWELIMVDNGSTPAVTLGLDAPANARIVAETKLGLTHARRRGFTEARGEYIVLADDDNVLSPDYLAQVLELFAAHPRVGALGGRSLPEFETTPPPWMREFDGLIACRDLGAAPKIISGLRDASTGRNEYPACAPIGAGLALRRDALAAWLAADIGRLTDRRGGELTSGGDNDIILTLMQHGWEVAYFPALSLTHLIPTGRITREYLARLNRGIAKSWVQVLQKHDANPWPPIAPRTVPLRQAKAYFTNRAWSGPAAFIRWQGACGHFEGLASLHRS